MTLDRLSEMAASDAASTTDARRMMAGKYGLKAVRYIGDRDWAGATDALIKAASRRPEYAQALMLVEAARGGSTTTVAKAAASRANGAKGGRPRRA